MTFLYLLNYALSQNQCKTFQCGSIQMVDDKPQCLEVKEGSTKFPVQECNSTSYCSASIWTTPDEATSNGVCKLTPGTTVVKIRAPGDFCDDKKECFGDDNEVVCNQNKCSTIRAAGAD